MSTFQARHYRVMARWLAAQHHTCVQATGDEKLWQELVERAVSFFEVDSLGFKPGKFRQACQPAYQVEKDLVG